MAVKLFYNVLALLAIYLIAPNIGNAQSSRDSLNQYVADLQKNPNDSALRAKIILLAQTIKPTLAIADEAREKYVMGITLREDKEYELAATNINKALLIAPWWGDAYKELGLALEAAKKYDEAIIAYQLYIKTMQDDEAISHVKDEIAIMKAKKMKAEKEKAEANSPQARESALLQKVEGARFVYHFAEGKMVYDRIYEIKNRTLSITLKIYSLKVEYGQSVDGYKQTGEYLQERISYHDGTFIHANYIASTQSGTLVTTKVTFVISIRPDGQALIIKRDDGVEQVTIPRQ